MKIDPNAKMYMKSDRKEVVETLDSGYTYFVRSGVTVSGITSMLKHKECLRKQCHHLIRLPNKYWKDRDKIKKLRKMNKMKILVTGIKI